MPRSAFLIALAGSSVLAGVLAASLVASTRVVRTAHGAAPQHPISRMTWSLKGTDGYKARLTISTFRGAKFGGSLPALPFSHRRSLGACTANAGTDWVLPVSLTLTNTTPGFAVPIDLRVIWALDTGNFAGTTDLALNGNFGPGGPIAGDAVTSRGATCFDGIAVQEFAVFGGAWNLPMRATAREDFYVIVHGSSRPGIRRGPGLQSRT